ncbi:MAG: hypothetical protein AAGC60_29185 [Acidobacteriota bacterium]
MLQRSSPRLSLAATTLLLAIFVAAPSFGQATPPYDRTIIVGGSGTDLVNGTNLLNAITAALASPTPPSPTNPWLIKVEPGIFDLGSQVLEMQNFLDIEGSGRNATFIRSDGAAAVQRKTVNVAAGVDAELRNLTVQYFATASGAGVVNESSELKLTQVNIEVEAAGIVAGIITINSSPRISTVFPRVDSTSAISRAFGLRIQGGAPIVNEMFIFIPNSTNRENVGIFVENGSAPVLEQISGVVFGGRNNVGIRVHAASARITNNRWSVSTGNDAIGVEILDSFASEEVGEVEIKESTFESAGASSSFGLLNRSAGLVVPSVEDSRLDAILGGGAVAVAVRNTVTGAATHIDQSKLLGQSALENAVAGTSFRVGSSKLDGVRIFAAGSSSVCAASYDGAYVPVPPGC